jgi:hypothetical protein
MSRITGTDAFNMMEAYNNVYAPQEEVELTEEQVQEDFENWVNSLVEEGYDLSEYTWEDMYEEYLNELTAFDAGGGKAKVQQLMRQGIGGVEANRRVSTTGEYLQRQKAQASTRPASAQNLRGLTIGPGGFNIQGKPVQPGMSPIFQRPGQPAPTRPVVQAPARPATQAPASAPARPAVQTSTRPASAPAPKPQLGPTGKPLVGGIERRTPTSAELRQAQQLRATGANLTGTGALATRPTTSAPAAATTPAPAATTSKPNLQQQIRQRRLNMDLDLFDIVQGYLIDEGYAETEEAAAVIMANMSEEWRQSIVEAYGSFGANMAGAELQRRATLKVREDERKKIEQEKKGSSGASSQVRGA